MDLGQMDTSKYLSCTSAEALTCLTGLLVGALLHRTLYIHGEWHLNAPQLLGSHGGILVFLHAGKALYSANQAVAVRIHLMLVFVYFYIIGLFISTVIYRYFFHPLTKEMFPGPWYARTSKLWHVWAARKAKNHLVLTKLHKKYGDFVRTGNLMLPSKVHN